MLRYLTILLIFLIPQTAFAASSSVSIVNEVNTSNSNSGNSDANVNTNIRIETNGEVTTYQSDEAGSVEVSVIDGKSEIKVDGIIVEHDENDSTTSPTLTPKSEVKTKVENKNILELFENLFKSLFSLLV